MKEHPILFTTEMIQAVLEGRKTMTRRIINPQPIDNTEIDGNFFDGRNRGYVKVDGHPNWQEQFAYEFCPKKVGDLLWVRETFQTVDTFPEPDCFGKYLYKSMGDTCEKWKPSIFMPKEAARIWLKITNIRVEKLQDISEEDAIAEGVNHGEQAAKSISGAKCAMILNAKSEYFYLWSKINGEESLQENPWVWVIEFKKTK